MVARGAGSWGMGTKGKGVGSADWPSPTGRLGDAESGTGDTVSVMMTVCGARGCMTYQGDHLIRYIKIYCILDTKIILNINYN